MRRESIEVRLKELDEIVQERVVSAGSPRPLRRHPTSHAQGRRGSAQSSRFIFPKQPSHVFFLAVASIPSRLISGYQGVIGIDTMGQVILYPGEDGFWVAECPSLPGCISQGRSREEAIENIKEAIGAYTAALAEDGIPVPEDRLDAILVAV